jgi:hypothetical protein
MVTSNDNQPRGDAARILPILGKVQSDGRIEERGPGVRRCPTPRAAHPSDPREA